MVASRHPARRGQGPGAGMARWGLPGTAQGPLCLSQPSSGRSAQAAQGRLLRRGWCFPAEGMAGRARGELCSERPGREPPRAQPPCSPRTRQARGPSPTRSAGALGTRAPARPEPCRGLSSRPTAVAPSCGGILLQPCFEFRFFFFLCSVFQKVLLNPEHLDPLWEKDEISTSSSDRILSC